MAPGSWGLTWWGKRWIAAIEALGAAYSNRLPRGRAYATDGSVRALSVGPGQVAAKVQGRRPSPYRVRLRVPELTDEQWDQVTDVLAGEVGRAAALLDGRFPDDLDELLAGLDLSLFPRADELDTACTCPDVANPCKHAAAVHYVLADRIDLDPFLLTAMRGRDREDLLDGIRAIRAGTDAANSDVDPEAADDGRLATLSAATLYAARDDLTGLTAHPATPTDPAALLRRLGPPPGFDAATTESLAEAVRRAASTAWLLAQADLAGDDPLLAALRERGSATAGELGDALGTAPPEVRTRLNTLMAEGLVHRTGHAKTTRYHA